MNRRRFLLATLGATWLADAARAARLPGGGEVMTVRGPLPANRLALTLTHEHVLVDFAGAREVGPHRYDADAVFRDVLPHLRRVRALGVRSMAEMTPAYLGRDPALLRRLSVASGLHLLTNTGYYGARDDAHLPEHAFTEPAERLAARWIAEWADGIGGTGIRPGFIKVGVDGGALSEVDEKLVRAGCRTHLATGLTLFAHTGPAAGALAQLRVLKEEGVDPAAWVWVHAQNEADPAHHVEVARRGAWISFDGVGWEPATAYLARLRPLRAAGLLGRVLLSHDAGWYRPGDDGADRYRPHTPILTDLVPALRADGFTDAELHRLLVRNPADALTIRVRRR